jgi:hypothetical protein
MGTKFSSRSCANWSGLNTASGLGVVVLVNRSSIANGTCGVGVIVGVSETEGVGVMVGERVIVGVKLIVGVEVMVGVNVGVFVGGK